MSIEDKHSNVYSIEELDRLNDNEIKQYVQLKTNLDKFRKIEDLYTESKTINRNCNRFLVKELISGTKELIGYFDREIFENFTKSVGIDIYIQENSRNTKLYGIILSDLRIWGDMFLKNTLVFDIKRLSPELKEFLKSSGGQVNDEKLHLLI